jgi:FkbM family methyltransferase
METAKKTIRRLLEYSGTGDWIYTKRILIWVFDRDIVAQLPACLRFFCAYARAYIRIIRTPTIIFGHGVFRLMCHLGHLQAVEARKILICDQFVWLDFSDPGALWAIQELSTGSPLQRLIKSLSANTDVFVDVGANQGIFSAIATRTINSTAAVIAIEPQKRLATCVEKTLEASGVKNWSVLKTAVSNVSGFSDFIIPKENKGEAHVAADPLSAESSISIKVETLDVLLGSVVHGSRVLVKMDIEGAEVDALQGGLDFFQRCSPALILEINPDAMARYGHSVEELKLSLSKLGYVQWASVEYPDSKFPIESLPHMQCDVFLEMASS